jgi:hypothetical protein
VIAAAERRRTMARRAGKVLLTRFHVDSDLARREELVECLRRNSGNDELDQFHVLLRKGVFDA